VLFRSSYKLFIFDLDGTLYDQRIVRFKMSILIVLRLLSFRIGMKDLKIISRFRKLREKNKGYSSPTLAMDQFIWCADELGLPVERIQATIEEFMYRLPLKFIRKALYKGVDEFIRILKDKGYKIAIYSDYPVDEKLEAMGLSADKSFCSTDPAINCLKPNKTGLLTICKYFDRESADAVYIGDRFDTDGESAKMAGIKFLLLDKAKARSGIYYKMLMLQI
jgi:FMN phosphatase YigB (HAD superfamily)